eukprot:GHVS01045891.1.p1 GENE.GHVS01045891.1~~GHVS01045891.1.p1  ORF type:complete len:198 (-),score=24.32 GHVS01045891.1:126-719(-)
MVFSTKYLGITVALLALTFGVDFTQAVKKETKTLNNNILYLTATADKEVPADLKTALQTLLDEDKNKACTTCKWNFIWDTPNKIVKLRWAYTNAATDADSTSAEQQAATNAISTLETLQKYMNSVILGGNSNVKFSQTKIIKATNLADINTGMTDKFRDSFPVSAFEAPDPNSALGLSRPSLVVMAALASLGIFLFA